MRLRPRAEVVSFKDAARVLCHFDHGYVVFPGGGIESNESAVHAAKRECLEESDRILINCTVAHPPTLQLWPEGYANGKGMKWAEGYRGGLSYWMTGSTSDEPYHPDPKGRHADFEASFRWHPIHSVIDRLKREVAGDWSDDVRTRLAILETHQKMNEIHKSASPLRLRLPG